MATNSAVPSLRPSYTTLMEKTITGTVTDLSTGEGLPGVNILVKGTTIGTITDVEGNYRLTAPDDAETLVFSSVGYTSEEVAIGTQTTINLQMNPDIQSLSEVVVVGYGTVKKSDITGSVASIESEEIKSIPATSVEQFIQGRAAGVQVTQNSSAPGGGLSIKVRGALSVNSGNEPLYVIDGFPVYPDNQRYSISGGSRANPTNALAMLNPNDIASIEILKDASATSIYGSRGANGVVLITTKRGEVGKPVLQYDMYYGIQTPAKTLDLLNAQEFAEYRNQRAINSGEPVPFIGATPAFPTPESLGEGTDWQDEVLRNASIQNHQLAVNGGTETVRYNISANYFSQDGIVINSDFKRGGLRANLDFEINDKLKIGTNLTFSRSISNIGQVESGGGEQNFGVVGSALLIDPITPVFDEGEYVIVSPRSQYYNPVAIGNGTKDVTISNRFLGTIFGTYEIVEGLTAKVSFGTDLTNLNKEVYNSRITNVGFGTNGSASRSNKYVTSWLNENTLNYNKTFNEIHSINIIGGFTIQEEEQTFFGASSRGFNSDLLQDNDLGSGSQPGIPTSGRSKWSLSSYLGRINYGLLDRYLLTLTARADGSSKFGTDNKWGFFPSAALAWRVSDEAFLAQSNAINDLKIRGSYGITGNSQIGEYLSLASLGGYNYTFGRTFFTGFGPTSIANSDLSWESTSMLNIGLDLGILNNRLRFTTDVYTSRTEDLLLFVPIPSTTGFTTSFQNAGSLENRGVELSISADILNGDFNWSILGNFSLNRNEMTAIASGEAFSGPNPAPSVSGAVGGRVEVGQPLGAFFGYEYDGVFASQAELDAGPTRPGDGLGFARYKDQDGDNTIAAEDRVIIGNPNPDYIFSIKNNFSWNNFDFSFFINAVIGQDIMNYMRVDVEGEHGFGNVTRDYWYNSWSPDNPTGDRPIAAFNNGMLANSSYFLEDGSFVRLQNVTLGYTFPANSVLRNARVFATAQNLLLFTDYSGFDPEVNVAGQSSINLGFDHDAYPRARTFTIGASIGF